MKHPNRLLVCDLAPFWADLGSMVTESDIKAARSGCQRTIVADCVIIRVAILFWARRHRLGGAPFRSDLNRYPYPVSYYNV